MMVRQGCDSFECYSLTKPIDMVCKVYEISKIVYQCTGDLTRLSKNLGQGVIYTK